MAKVTWLGEPGSEETTAFGQTFRVGEPVEIKDEETLNTAKGNRYFKVAGDKSETVESNPELMPADTPTQHEHDQVENMAFVNQERLDAHAEASQERADNHDEIVQAHEKRGPGRPRKNG